MTDAMLSVRSFASDAHQAAPLTCQGHADTAPARCGVAPAMSMTHGVRLTSTPTNAGLNTWLRLDLTAALTYNVRVGTGPGLNDVVPSLSLTNGVRLVAAPGNAGFRTWLAPDLSQRPLPTNTLYWSVQAVDNSFAGGPFASEASFTMPTAGGGLFTIARLTARSVSAGGDRTGVVRRAGDGLEIGSIAGPG